MGRFVRVRTSDLIPTEKMPFPEEWNMKPSPWFPGAVPDLAGWVGQLVSTSSYAERSWRDLTKGLGDNVVMRPPPPGEEEVPKPTKDKKRRRASPRDTPKPRKSRARKSKTDPAVLSTVVVQTLRDEDDEGEDADCLLVARKREGIEASRTAELVTVEEVQPQTEATALHREASSKYRAELARCEADLKKLTEERDALKLLYVQNKEEIMSIRAKLTRAHQDQTELIERKVEELETRLATELARATSEAEALVASYRADAEAANTRAKEFSDAAEVRLFCVAEHARRQSRRETLQEVHARGFDLTTDIESAKVSEDEAGALLSDDEDSASGSENGGDEDKAPEDAAPEAD
ncbi:uncharacterized protein [Nicotiana tomentosiformis]|uniref:uncharacterized protein n=1 Tax=Nicotiana tomentosiformis TaxID=4098 RepID=UPI00388C4731